MRLFVAVYPPADAVADLTAQVGALAIGAPRPPGQSLRLVPPERWHITLAFLGDVPDGREPRAHAALAAAAGEGSAAAAPRLWFGGGGRFGKGRFTIMWLGVRGDVAAVGELAAGVRGHLRAAKLPFDPKSFRPHLTLARPGDRLPATEVAGDLAALDRYEGPKWTVDAIELVRSHPGPHIRYDRLATFPLHP